VLLSVIYYIHISYYVMLYLMFDQLICIYLLCMSGDAVLMLSSLLLLDVSSSCTNADEHFLKSCRKNRVKVNTGLNFYRIVMDAFNWSCQF